jgi:hypothetical protein
MIGVPLPVKIAYIYIIFVLKIKKPSCIPIYIFTMPSLRLLLLGAVTAVGSSTSSSTSSSIELCLPISSCVECTESRHRCAWQARGRAVGGGACAPAPPTPPARSRQRLGDTYVWDDTCPVDYAAQAGTEAAFLPDWMGGMMGVIGAAPLLGLSLPGTHDSLTFDLSLRVSDGGIDGADALAELLHNSTERVPDMIEDFMRIGAQTQDLSVTQQLEAGIRFLDIRMMLEYSDSPAQWYSLHMMQSTGTSLQYFKDIRAWMDAHPSEVVVMWLSKHGNECATGEEQYPSVSVEQKQEFWAEILTVFDGLAVDFSETKLNETSLSTMVERNHRAVFYVADYVEMTGYAVDGAGPYFALDSCLIDNQLGNPSGPAAVQWGRDIYAGADARKAADSPEQRFYLLSLAGGMDYPDATLLKFGVLDKIPTDDAEIVARCAATFGVPGMDWCPETLLDGSQLSNYYAQVAMDEVVDAMLAGDTSYGLPNAIYINAIGSLDGTIRTGTEVLWGKNRSPDPTYAKQGYSYVDSFVLYNVLNVCTKGEPGSAEGGSGEACRAATDLLLQRRAAHPMTLWDDATYGRLSTW